MYVWVWNWIDENSLKAVDAYASSKSQDIVSDDPIALIIQL